MLWGGVQIIMLGLMTFFKFFKILLLRMIFEAINSFCFVLKYFKIVNTSNKRK